MSSKKLIIVILVSIAVYGVASALVGKFLHWGGGLAMAMVAILSVAIVGIIDGRRGS